MTVHPSTVRRQRALALLLAALALGCASREAVNVQLQADLPARPALRDIDIHAQVVGPQAGLHYKWFSVSGQCDPQESDIPTTIFTFAQGAPRDRVSVEVWRDGKQVAQTEMDVKLDDARAMLALAKPSGVEIEITEVPPYQPDGGPDTHADIAGTVTGPVSAGDRVVVYARADVWYIQPSPHTLHEIAANHTWHGWTHTGSSYAAFVVRPGVDMFSRLDVLPQVGSEVLARTIVEGKR